MIYGIIRSIYHALVIMSPHTLIKNKKRFSYQLPFSNINELLLERKTKYPQKEAIVFDNFLENETLTISYKKLYELTSKLAGYLEKNLKEGESLSYSLSNTPEIVLLNYACWTAGFVSVPLDTKRDTVERKVYKLKLTNTKILFTRNDKESKQENKEIKRRIPGIKIVEYENFHSFEKMVRGENEKKVFKANTKTSLILFTSGTTALPKGAKLTLANLFSNAESIIDWLSIKAADRFHIFLPLHHINSTTFTNSVILAGGTIILSPQYSKSRFWETMMKNEATITSIVPTVAYDLVKDTDFDARKHIRELKKITRIQIGSAPVQPSVALQFIENFGIPLFQGYGQTETSLRSTGVPMSLKKSEYLKIVKLNSLGTELKYTNVTVLNEYGKEVKEGELGEICIRGPIIMQAYLDKPEETKESFLYDWFHSGDTGYWKKLYGKKFFFLKGRTKEIIKKAGTLISPLAIENALLNKYKSLDMAYAVGFPDARLGEEIGVVFVTKDPSLVSQIEKDSSEFKITGIAPFEHPKAFLQIREEDFPKTSTGKVQRIKIKELFKANLLSRSRYLGSSQLTTFRIIGAEEEKILKEAVRINNLMWGIDLHSSIDEFKSRAENGVLIGAFDKEKLLGTVSVLRINKKDVEKIGKKGHWTNTWDGITAKGKFTKSNFKGDALLCPAISVETKNITKPLVNTNKQKLSNEALKKYLNSEKDYVIRFHRKPKGGLREGAQLTNIIPNSRPEDKDSLGLNVVFTYPELSKSPQITKNSSIGQNLIESVMIYAYKNNIKKVYAYSRPAEISKYFSEDTHQKNS